MARRRNQDSSKAMYVISVAAELAGVHPQTLRVYERKGLIRPHRTAGNTRRYSESDIQLLRRIQQLTEEGVNLAGVVRILALEDEIEEMRGRYESLVEEFERIEVQLPSRNAMALVPLRDVRRIRRAMKSDAVDRAGRRRVFAAPPIRSGDRRGGGG
jgi:MerR family transcriptional regulator, heat shock protein HspR